MTERRRIENVVQLTDTIWEVNKYKILKKIEPFSAPLPQVANIFNGIQTSAERPQPIYWFAGDEIISEDG